MKILKFIPILLLLSLLSNTSLAQHNSKEESNIRIDHRFGISSKFGGAYAILAGLAVDAFVTPYINAELNYSPMPVFFNIRYIGGGLNIHPLGGNKSRWSPYLGLFYGYASGTAFLTGEHKQYRAANFPIGVQYIGSTGFSFSIELGLSWVRKTIDSHPYIRDEFYPPPGIKIGYRF